MEIHVLALALLSTYSILITILCIVLAIQRHHRNLINQGDNLKTLHKENLLNVLSNLLTKVYTCEQTTQHSLDNPRDFFFRKLSKILDDSELYNCAGGRNCRYEEKDTDPFIYSSEYATVVMKNETRISFGTTDHLEFFQLCENGTTSSESNTNAYLEPKQFSPKPDCPPNLRNLCYTDKRFFSL